jgi:pilus assembly protein CpaC
MGWGPPLVAVGMLAGTGSVAQTTATSAPKPARIAVPVATRAGTLQAVDRAPRPLNLPALPATSVQPGRSDAGSRVTLAQATVPPPSQPEVVTPGIEMPAQPPAGPHVVVPGGGVPPSPQPDTAVPEPLANAPGAAPAASTELREVASARQELTVFVNNSKLFELGPGQKIVRAMIDNPKVADIQFLDDKDPSPHILGLTGYQFGRTALTIWFDGKPAVSYTVRVIIDEKDLEKRLHEILPGSDVTVRQVAQQIILEGQVPDTKTMTQVLDLVQSELRLTGQVSVGSLAGAVGLGANAGAPPGGQNMMVTSQGQSPLGVATVGNTQPGLIIVNRVRVPGPRQVVLKVKIAELNRTALRQIGVSWLDARNNAILGSTIGNAGGISATANPAQASAFGPAGFLPGTLATSGPSRWRVPQFEPVTSTFNANGLAATGTGSQLFGIFNAGEFNLFLNALRTNSLAKILAEPNLVALDGQPASFQAGGQFPYPVPQAATAGGGSVITIQFAQFGAILEFLPHIQENDVIRLDVAPTFSELNPAAGFAIPGAGTVPGINQRTAHTVVEMREGQTLAIAGLLQTTTSATVTRIPGLGDLPIVGTLFSNNQIQTVETELVVLVTPEMVAPMNQGEVPPSPGDLVLEPNDCEFYILGRIEGKTGHPFRSTVQEHDPANVMKHLRSEGSGPPSRSTTRPTS